MSIEKANEIIKGIQTGEIGCTIEEFKNAIKNNKELNEKDLKSVSGGVSLGHGGCQRSRHVFYDRDCASTVEEGSWCKSNDWCFMWDEEYKVTNC